MSEFTGNKFSMSDFMGARPNYGGIGEIGQRSRNELTNNARINEATYSGTAADAANIVGQAVQRARVIEAGGEAAVKGINAQGNQNLMNQALGGLDGIFSSLGSKGSFGNPFGANKEAGTAGWIDFGQGGGPNYANSNGSLMR